MSTSTYPITAAADALADLDMHLDAYASAYTLKLHLAADHDVEIPRTDIAGLRHLHGELHAEERDALLDALDTAIDEVAQAQAAARMASQRVPV